MKAGVNGSFVIRTHALSSSHSPTKIRALTQGVAQGDVSWRAPLLMARDQVVPQVPHFIEHLLNAWLGLISNTQKFLVRYSLLPSHLHGEVKAQRIELTCLDGASSSKWVLHLDAKLNKAIHGNHFI